MAWAHVIPDNEGTVTSGLPDDSTTVTVEPSFCETFGAGLCDTTSPAATVIDVTGAPSFKFIWTLATAALACANGRFTTAGVGCDAVNTFVAKAVTRPAARMTANRTAAPIHHHFRLFGGRYGSAGPPVLSGVAFDFAFRRSPDRPSLDGSASKSSPGPAFVPIGAPAGSPGAIAVPSPTAVPAATPAANVRPESVNSDTPGARKPLLEAESSSLGMINGKGEGDGNAEASAPSRAARPAASRRAATSGAAARASTSSKGPNRSLCGSGCPIRAARVPMVVSVTKGTTPVTAS